MSHAQFSPPPSPVQVSEPADDRPLLDGRYQLIRKLSRGSFGETLIAQDTRRPGHPECVVKQLRPAHATTPATLAAARQRFDQEATILEKLGHHDQIPRLLAHFEAEGEFYLVQELIVGPSLQQVLTAQPPWSMDRVRTLLVEILEILTFVHSAGVIHRDIKPENILHRAADNRWVLIDFGAVKQLATSDESFDLGQGTMAIYSAGYTPAEQLEGHPCPGSDLYALGILGLQCLTGQAPSEFKPELRQQGLPWLNQVVGHPGIAAVLEKMTRPHWQERYQTATSVLTDLVAGGDGNPANETIAADNVDGPLRAAGQPTGYTPTAIAPPKPPPAIAKIRIPTAIVAAPRSPQPESLPPRQFTVDDAASPTAFTEARQFWDRLPRGQQVRGQLYQPTRSWLKAHNIYRVEELMAFLLCIALVLGCSSVLTFWVFKIATAPRRVTPAEANKVTTTEVALTTLSSEAPIHDLALAPNSAQILSADESGRIIVWDLAAQQPIQTTKNFGAVWALALSQDGRRLASGDEYANITLWDRQTGQTLHTWRDHQLPILSLAFSPDGKTLVSTAQDNSVIIWDVESSQPRHQLRALTEPINATTISPDGQFLIGGGEDFTLKVWNLHTGQLVNTLAGHSGPIRDVAMTANGAIVVSGSEDKSIKIWNFQTGELVSTLSGHLEAVTAIALSPDSQRVVSGSQDGSLRLWDLYSGELMQKMNNFQGPISAIAQSTDGQYVVSSTTRGHLNLWQISETNNHE